MNIDAIAYLERLRKLVKDLPGVTEGSSYGTPAFHVNKKLFARIKEDGISLVVHTADRDELMKKSPAVFYITDHYMNYPAYVLIRMNKITDGALKDLLIVSWRLRASARLLKEYDNNH